MLHEYLPTDLELLTANSDISLFYQRMFQDEAEILSNLKFADVDR